MTANHLRLIGAEHREQPGGVLVLRSGNTRDVIDYWNLRAMGVDVTAVPSGASSDTWEALLTGPLPTQTWKSRGPNPTSWEVLSVCGAEGVPAALLDLLNARAAQFGATVRPEDEVSWPRGAFPGVTTRFTRSFSQDSRPTAQSIDVRLPELPLVDSPSAYLRGVIAAEIQPHASQGHDPRFTAAIPPYRRHSELLEPATNLRGIRQRRSTAGGQVMGVDATPDVAPLVFAFNLDVFQRLFDDPSVGVSQSDIGKFQSRAAERLGGPFGGVFNQPGARAVLSETAKKGEGIHLDHMRRTFADHKGTWPGWLIGDEKNYSPREVNRLLNTGLFVPTSRVHCAHCRVDRWLSADDLAARVECELCGEQFNLALSHSLTKPEWRYRLAAHLRPDQVDSLVSVLATTSLLGRARVERSRLVKTSRDDLAPNVPLVLTGPDLSHPPMSEDHPWRWDHRFQGLLGTALTSCKRNLGLEGYQPTSTDEIAIHWSPSEGPSTTVAEGARGT